MKFINIFIVLLFLSGCANSQNKVGEFFQTDNATLIRENSKEIITLLLSYKEKLDKRNPQNYDKKLVDYISREFKNSTNQLFLKKGKKYISIYNDYLKMSMSKEKVINRNDYLILGIYKQIYSAYQFDEVHKVTAFSYDIEKLKNLYYSLQVLNWQIKHRQDNSNNYLFLTWQNNWQIELKQRIQNAEKPSWELIENLEYIKNKKESIFSPSNSSYEVLMQKMIYKVENSLKILGTEPLDVSIEIMKTLVFFL